MIYRRRPALAYAVPAARSALVALVAAACTSAPEWRPAAAPLMTRWAALVGPSNARPEYPRPLMVRAEWLNLNGLWDYAITAKDAEPGAWSGKILVPFAVESALSGVGDTVGPSRTLWYHRTFRVPQHWIGRRVLLHFEASDWETRVWVNGHPAGTHRGGYDPFTFDITALLGGRGGQEIRVAVWDPTDSGPQPRGKQVRKPGGIFYTSVTGIWQTVWLEPVGETALRDYAVTTDIDSGTVTIAAEIDGVRPGDRIEATLRAPAEAPARGDGARPVAPSTEAARASGPANAPLATRVARPHLWSPDDPYLYDLELRVVRDGEVVDEVRGYVGMRRIAVGPDSAGVTRLLLNGRFVFQHGPLDQGYWPDGLYTAPSESAMVSDLRVLKGMGFNMLRKHVKVEPRTFYTWCDRIGLLVWQDMPSASIPLARPDADRSTDTAATQEFERELLRMIATHRNNPSIVMWVPFNEGWGQYDTPRIARLVHDADPTRLVNAASGWYERGGGDVVDRHNYPAPDPPRPEATRAAVQGEFGGLGLVVRRHTWREGGWGYDLFGNEESLVRRFEDLYGQIGAATQGRGLSAAVYTQTSDVETENNGLLTYDRAQVKIPPMSVRLAFLGYAAPRAVRGASIFIDSAVVALSTARPGATIRYTTDGTPPRRMSAEYTAPFAVKETATVMARAYWPDGAWSRVSSFGFARVAPREALPVTLAQPGLVVDYFEQDGSWRRLPVFDSLAALRSTTSTAIGLAHAARRENFGLRFRGYLRVPATGVYGFHLSSDDGSRLSVDGRPVVENDGIHGMREVSGWVALEGGMHAFDLVYFQGCCGVGLTLAVEPPGASRRALPPQWLFHRGGISAPTACGAGRHGPNCGVRSGVVRWQSLSYVISYDITPHCRNR